MALIHCDFYSEVLGISTSICVILPQNTKTQIGMGGSSKKIKYPTRSSRSRHAAGVRAGPILGHSDNDDIWA